MELLKNSNYFVNAQFSLVHLKEASVKLLKEKLAGRFQK